MKTKTTLTKLIAITAFLFGISNSFGQVVTSSTDDGSAGTLRNQVAMATPGATITFDPSVTNILLTTGQITIDKSLTLTGNGTTTINGNANGRIFDVTAGNFNLNNLMLTNGLADNGGAIQVTGANLTLNN